MLKVKSIGSYHLISKNQFKQLNDKIVAQEAEINSATLFIKEIEKGNLETVDVGNADVNSLAGSLVTMRNKMKTIAQEESERNWITLGLTKFSDILRSNTDDLKKLSNIVISELVKYMNVNQGGLYLIDSSNSETSIELVAAYAYNRQKFIQQKIELGDGLLGQAALEKETVYLKEIPPNYVRITSGLGEALPRNLIIVPLKLEEEIYGLVELASFNEIKKHQIQFVEKLGEALASAIAAVRNAEHTQKLLQESQLQTQQLRAQDEEVRQNMEELSATQEEMQRILSEVQKNRKEINELINISGDSILTIDREYKIILFNKVFADTFHAFKIEKGFDVLDLYSGENQKRKRETYDKVFKGEVVEYMDHVSKGGLDIYFKLKYAPLFDDNDYVHSIAIFASEITELYKAKEKAEQIAEEAQQQAEELRSQEEEIRQNMEELSSTQEEMQRILNEVQKNEEEFKEIINISSDIIYTLDKDYKVVRFNNTFVNSFKGIKIEKGFNIFEMYNEDDRKRRKEIFDQVFAGKTIETESHINADGHDNYYKMKYAPISDKEGKIVFIVSFASDVTELYKAKARTELLVRDTRNQSHKLEIQRAATQPANVL